MMNVAKAPRGMLLLCASMWVVSFLPSLVHGIQVCPSPVPDPACNVTNPVSYQVNCNTNSCTKPGEKCCPSSCGLECQGTLTSECNDEVKRDLVFVVENAGSSESDFEKWNFFINLIIKGFTLGVKGLRVAVVIHGGPATVYFGFSDPVNNDIETLTKRISKIPFISSTPTGSLEQALETANGMFASGYTLRGRGVVVIGSGRITDTGRAKTAVDALRSKYVKIFGIVVGDLKWQQLKTITTKDSRVDTTLFTPASALELDRFGKNVVDAICKTVHPQCCDWRSWGRCSKTCDAGKQSRRRRPCSKADAGRICPTEERDCNFKPCKRCCEWSRWSRCSVTCGGGVQSQNQQVCTTAPPGTKCPEKTRRCSTKKCQKLMVCISISF